ncbi:MAG: phosphatase PAP2 family protein [Thermodesulfobacteriota bacterium]
MAASLYGGGRTFALAGLLLFALAVMVFHWDAPVQAFFSAHHQQAWSRLWAQAAYYAGLGGAQGGLMAAVAFVAWRLGRRVLAVNALGGVAAVVASGAAVQVVKHLAGRPRPRLDLPAWEYFGPSLSSDLHSFPSGHAATSFALAGLLAACYPRLAAPCHLAAIFISLGRVVGGSHYLSDVVGGALLGLLVGWPLAASLRRWQEEAT